MGRQTVTVQAKGFGDPKSEMMREVVDYFDRIAAATARPLGTVVEESLPGMPIEMARKFLSLSYAAGHATGFADALNMVLKANESVAGAIRMTIDTFASLMDDMQKDIGGVDGVDRRTNGAGLEGASRWIESGGDRPNDWTVCREA